MKAVEVYSNSPEETQKTGFVLASILEKNPSSPIRASILALSGDLGAGKTAFIQGLARGLKIKEDVSSPTFVIQKDFRLSLKKYKNFYHIDAYRLKNPEELLELGFEDLIKNPENIIAVEWADKVENILPKDVLKIKFENLGGNKRKISIFSLCKPN
ncbi:tRNA (adenosine(37)-N6)-threonylcarbamoyltransferase complex ATPase subunit type 1 TsaE [Candidatus Azambacteria bacterium]|nr:tRNA (adenosine(37)-N6)-threonylcarbamoyltransferase complex ATPase subunit type 1 TsaE [Candidatus Azambacteria bacterium]